MNLHAHITDTASNETRIYHFEEREEDLGLMQFDWGENNHACDCNRAYRFEEATNPDWRDTEVECGDVRYRVRILNDAGEVVYEDDKPQPCLT